MAAYNDTNNFVINKLSFNKYKELKNSGQIDPSKANEVFVVNRGSDPTGLPEYSNASGKVLRVNADGTDVEWSDTVNTAVIFANLDDMIQSLNNEVAGAYDIGQSIFIAEKDVPDFWVYSIEGSRITGVKHEEYTEQFYQYGYYKLALLESAKAVFNSNIEYSETEPESPAIGDIWLAPSTTVEFPEYTTETSGKYLGVDSTGNLEWQEVQGADDASVSYPSKLVQTQADFDALFKDSTEYNNYSEIVLDGSFTVNYWFKITPAAKNLVIRGINDAKITIANGCSAFNAYTPVTAGSLHYLHPDRNSTLRNLYIKATTRCSILNFTSIENCVFENLASGYNPTLDINNVFSIKDSTFYNCEFTYCSSLENVAVCNHKNNKPAYFQKCQNINGLKFFRNSDDYTSPVYVAASTLFRECKNITNVYFDEPEYNIYESSSGYTHRVFESCKNISNIYFSPSSVTYSFYGPSKFYLFNNCSTISNVYTDTTFKGITEYYVLNECQYVDYDTVKLWYLESRPDVGGGDGTEEETTPVELPVYVVKTQEEYDVLGTTISENNYSEVILDGTNGAFRVTADNNYSFLKAPLTIRGINNATLILETNLNFGNYGSDGDSVNPAGDEYTLENVNIELDSSEKITYETYIRGPKYLKNCRVTGGSYWPIVLYSYHISDCSFKNCKIDGAKSVSNCRVTYDWEEGSISDAFSNCKNLSNIKFDNSENFILSSGLFTNCTNISGVYFDEDIKYPAGYVFADCNGITNVEFKVSEVLYDLTVFNNCSHISNFTYANDGSTIPDASKITTLSNCDYVDYDSVQMRSSETADPNTITKRYVDNSIAALVDSAPEDLNTLKELSTAIKENDSVLDTLNEAITDKQDKLESGVNIKTINGQSILDAGNIDTSNVKANPTISGTEARLTGISVDNVTYRIPSNQMTFSEDASEGYKLKSITVGNDVWSIPDIDPQVLEAKQDAATAYNFSNIVFSDTEPANPTQGMIWLKRV